MAYFNVENITELMLRRISKDEFLTMENLSENDMKECVCKELLIAMEKQQPIRVDNLLFLVFHFDLLDKEMEDILNQLLACDWHMQHENIAMLLQKLKSPNSIEVLYETAIKEYEYLDYDEAHALAVKCIWALGDIGTEHAEQKLKLLLNSHISVIKENAQKQLDRIDKKRRQDNNG